LLTAAYAGHQPIVQLLCDKGANLEAKDENGFTPLMAACSNGFLVVCRYLVKKGVNVNAVTKDGNSAITIASNGDFKSVVRLLFESGCNIPQAYEQVKPDFVFFVCFSFADSLKYN
jgi:ankyrin repeat protein